MSQLAYGFYPIFHERANYIDINCHFVRETVLSDKITTGFCQLQQPFNGYID